MWSLNRARKELANWRCAVGQSSTYLGLALIGFIWISLSFHLQVERSAAERAAIQNSRNLVRVFEEHLSRSMHDIDRALKVLRSHYLRNPAGFDFEDWKRNAEIVSDPATRVSIIGPDGSSSEHRRRKQCGRRLQQTRALPGARQGVADELFISSPVVGFVSGSWRSFSRAESRTPTAHSADIIVASLRSELFCALLQLGRYRNLRLCQNHRDRRHRPRRGRRHDEFHRTRHVRRSAVQALHGGPDRLVYTDSALSDNIHRADRLSPAQGFPLIVNLGLRLSRFPGSRRQAARLLRVCDDIHGADPDRHHGVQRARTAVAGAQVRRASHAKSALRRGAAEHVARPLDVRSRRQADRLQRSIRAGLWLAGGAEARHDAEADPGAQSGVRDLRGTDAGGLRCQTTGGRLATQAHRHHRRA